MRIVLSSFWFPVGAGAYFLRAAKNIPGLEVITVGPTSGPAIPWGPQFNFPEHAIYPTITVPPEGLDLETGQSRDPRALVEMVKALGGCDLWLDVDGTWFVDAPMPWPHAVFATDPHIGDQNDWWQYGRQRQVADFFFNCQKAYTRRIATADGLLMPQRHDDIYLPGGYDPVFHPDDDERASADVTVLGAPYPKRRKVAEELAARGFRVYTYPTGFGGVYDQARKDLLAAPVTFIWSLKDDLCWRVFEAAACARLIVANEVPGLDEALGGHYQSFDGSTDDDAGIRRAVEAVEGIFAKKHGRWMLRYGTTKTIAENAEAAVQYDTWEHRLRRILAECSSNGRQVA